MCGGGGVRVYIYRWIDRYRCVFGCVVCVCVYIYVKRETKACG